MNIGGNDYGSMYVQIAKVSFFLPVLDVNEAPRKGCSYPLYASPQQSSGTVLGYLNVTDPDNEIFDTKSQENCEKKQQLRITIDSEHEDLLPFKVADGYLVKYGVSMGIYVRLLDWIIQSANEFLKHFILQIETTEKSKVYLTLCLKNTFQEIQANKTYSLLIFVEDDGVVSNMSSDQMVYNKITTSFNCTVISTSKSYYLVLLVS